MTQHAKYRCADYTQHETLKDAKKHAAQLSKGVDNGNKHIALLIYQCVDCKAFYGIYLPYCPKVREKAVKQTAEIIKFPENRTLRTNPGLIEGEKVRRQHFYRIQDNGDVWHHMISRRSDNYVLLDIDGDEWTPIEDYGNYVASDIPIENPIETWLEMIENKERRAA